MRAALEGGLGLYLAHLGIWVQLESLYRPDEVHTSNKENVMFLKDLQQSVRALLGHRGVSRDLSLMVAV